MKKHETCFFSHISTYFLDFINYQNIHESMKKPPEIRSYYYSTIEKKKSGAIPFFYYNSTLSLSPLFLSSPLFHTLKP